MATETNERASSDEEKASRIPESSEEAKPRVTEDAPASSTGTSLKPMVLYGVLALLAIAAVVIPVSIVVSNKDDESSVGFRLIFNDTGELPIYDEGILQEYASFEEFADDFAIASQKFINGVAERSATGQYYAPYFVGRGGPMDGLVVEADDAASPGAPPAPPTGERVDESVNDFGTNNQEEGVEEGDVIVASANAVYAAYGDMLLSWNATSGERFHTIQIKNDIWEQDSYRGWISIKSLVLQGNRLLVVVDGDFDAQAEENTRLLAAYLRTRLLVFEVGNDGSQLTLAFQKDISGYFSAVRAEGENVHVVTMSGLQIYQFLGSPLDLWDTKWTETRLAGVRAEADTRLIPSLIETVRNELSVDGAFPHTVRLCQWQTNVPENGLGDYVYYEGFTNSVAMITSFSIFGGTTAADGSTVLSTSSSAIFMPSFGGQVYATSGMMLIATTGYDFSPKRDAMIEKTYLVALSLGESNAQPHAIGVVDGYFLNQLSFDIVPGSLRVATSIQNSWFWNSNSRVGQESSTENYVTTMDLPSPSSGTSHVMKQMDQIALGKPNELFTAVRFFDHVAYAVTFERTDPFYVLNMTDPYNIEILADVEITGFSTYLHSMNEENCLILAIGEEATEQGRVVGLQVSVFDACDVDNVSVVRHTLEDKDNVYSSSQASWNFKAVRFNRETGRLIIPVDIYSYDNNADSFHGFKVYIATADSITDNCSIETGNQANDGDFCFSCGRSFEPRSMIFGGDLTTTKAHFVTSTDLNSCEQVWQFRLEVDSESSPYYGGCCGYW